MTTKETALLAPFLGIGMAMFGMALLGALLGVRGPASGMPLDVFGLVMSAYFAGYIAGTFWWPAVVRRVGLVRAFAAAAAVAGVVALCHPQWVHPLPWALLRFAAGSSVVGLFIVIETWLATVATRESRGGIFAIYQMVTLAGLALGQLPLAFGEAHTASLFELAAICCSLALVPVVMTRIPEPDMIPAPRTKLLDAIQEFPLASLGSLIAGAVVGTFWGLGTAFVTALGRTPADAALFSFSVILGGACLQWPVALLADRFGRRALLAGTSIGGALAATCIGALAASGYAPNWLAGFIFGGMCFSLYALCLAKAHDEASNADAISISTSLLLIYGCGSTLGPALGGAAMAAFTPAGLFLLMAGFLGLYALLVVHPASDRLFGPVWAESLVVPIIRTSPVELELFPLGDPPEADAPCPVTEEMAWRPGLNRGS
ncbi:MAG: MFS transporter [Deltaproteobacteria bacterium]